MVTIPKHHKVPEPEGWPEPRETCEAPKRDHHETFAIMVNVKCNLTYTALGATLADSPNTAS